MKTISVHEDGTELAYLDSGAPEDATYTTIFAVHGVAFSSRSFFDPLFALLLSSL